MNNEQTLVGRGSGFGQCACQRASWTRLRIGAIDIIAFSVLTFRTILTDGTVSMVRKKGSTSAG
jgi:hypothetical protein